jgi:triacylglycerol lipase
MLRVYLIPGFFGFSDLGDLTYWGPAQQALASALRERTVAAEIHVVPTPPTATLRARARVLARKITETAQDDDELVLVGHSSGGLDARLFLTPGVQLADDLNTEAIASRIRSVVTVATPHRGTPSAELFSSLYGKRLLRLLSVATVAILRRGSLPLNLVLRLVQAWRSAASRLPGSREPSLDDHLFDALLSEFSPERRTAVKEFFGDIRADQGLLSQITPTAMDLFRATAPDRASIRYGCVVVRGRRPTAKGIFSRALSPSNQAMAAIYASCWALASRTTADHLDPLREDQAQRLREAYGDLPIASDNDGMVPVLSQVHGEVIRAITADHLDVLGHYPDPEATPPRYDWLTSGSGFRRPHFDATWQDVAEFIVG